MSHKPINVFSDFTCFYDTVSLNSGAFRKDKYSRKGQKEVEATHL